DGMFHISSYTRNGIFFAPVFLLLGVLTAFAKRLYPMRICVWGTALSAVLLMGEGFLTYSLKWQRHNSMYLFLVPLMYFLFQLLLLIPGKAPAFCRNGSLILYVIHPAVIVVLRGTAKAAGLKELLIDHAFIQYILVCAVSMAAAAVFAGVKKNCLMKISR
ncbi:MAG: amino-acid racemase, partial [Lachnospiraceae bacterium]|nr:amino-acid racemase [Lachnospiraceae bacterium]